MVFWLYLITSFLLVAFGHPVWISGFGVFAGAIGVALFWKAASLLPRFRDRFVLSLLWFGAIQGVQLSWLTSIKYMGPLILVIYLLLILFLGAQFGLLSFFLKKERPLGVMDCLAMGGFWVWMEWLRLFILTGFTWNPLGLALADSTSAIQFASLFGVYGLSFWVIFVNALGFKALFLDQKKSSLALWIGAAICPYLYGFGNQIWVQQRVPSLRDLSVALVQTGLTVEEKDFLPERPKTFVPPLEQWDRLLSLFAGKNDLDLLVLPEAAVTMGANRPFYPIEMVRAIWAKRLGEEALKDLPALKAPYAVPFYEQGMFRWKVTNSYFAQGLANYFKADLIVGFDDFDVADRRRFNAAFHFKPGGIVSKRYEKRVLVPVGEYIPLKKWRALSEFVAAQFGIADSFDLGTEAKIFEGVLPMGVSICLEETYSRLIRDLRLKGAELFVNVTNDVWFPNSRLPEHHFQHGRIRAVENGVGLVRSCNTGITAAIDCLGRPLAQLPASEEKADILVLSLPVRSYQTLYTWWGDGAILLGSAVFLFSYLAMSRIRLKEAVDTDCVEA